MFVHSFFFFTDYNIIFLAGTFEVCYSCRDWDFIPGFVDCLENLPGI